MEENVQQAWTRLGYGLGAEVHEEPEVLWFLSRFPFHLANGIVRTHLPEHAVEERLKQFTAYHLPIVWLASSSTQPASLGTRLEQQGWMREDAPGMALDLSSLDESPSHPSQLTITRVSDVEHLNIWLRVMTVGHEPGRYAHRQRLCGMLCWGLQARCGGTLLVSDLDDHARPHQRATLLQEDAWSLVRKPMRLILWGPKAPYLPRQ